MLQPAQGWIWAPGSRRTFQPGDVYWMRSANLVGWGPLAPGEAWNGADTPTLYLKATSHHSRGMPTRARSIRRDSARRPRTRSPPLALPARCSRRGSMWIARRLPGVRSRRSDSLGCRSPPPPPLSVPVERPRPPVTQTPRPAPQPAPQVAMAYPAATERPAAPEPAPLFETFYIAPSYRGVIVMNPPRRNRRNATAAGRSARMMIRWNNLGIKIRPPRNSRKRQHHRRPEPLHQDGGGYLRSDRQHRAADEIRHRV